MSKKCVIITSINPPNNVINFYANETDHDLIIVGDTKTPNSYKDVNCIFLDLESQKKIYPLISAKISVKHYARKNIGYIYAIKHGYNTIYDTDDDTLPYNQNWLDTPYYYSKVVSGGIINLYRLFSNDLIWPRGFPLNKIRNSDTILYRDSTESDISSLAVTNGLIDLDPDVDAIFRLTSPNFTTNYKFINNHLSFILESDVIFPSNTQNTIWLKKEIFIFMYIPSTVSFRYCDILRSYILLYGLRSLNLKLGIHGSNVYQIRNEHDLMKDFYDEVPVYTSFNTLITTLDTIDLNTNSKTLMKNIYSKLASVDIVKADEMDILNLWLDFFD